MADPNNPLIRDYLQKRRDHDEMEEKTRKLRFDLLDLRKRF
jgi:hypothetical protein